MSIRSRKKSAKPQKVETPIREWAGSVITLLDLLAGWGAYTDNPLDISKSDRKKPAVIAALKYNAIMVARIADLYQAAGALDNPTDNQIRRFVIDRIIPLILNKDANVK